MIVHGRNPDRSPRSPAMKFETLVYTIDGPVATITLNRPAHLNTIVPPMPDEIEAAVNAAVRDDSVKVMILRGAGRSFCGGFDFGTGFHHWDDYITTDGEWDAGKDFMFATAQAVSPTQKFMSLWRSPKPVIAQVHGWCVGGGSDYALCADLVIASEDARIGTPYSRMWGAYLSGLWLYRLGLTKAKEYALTGKPLSGREAADCGLINQAVPFVDLESTVRRTAAQLASIPLSQLSAMKLIVNQAYENMGLASTQALGPILDGLMRNTPDAKRFIEIAREQGVRAAVAQRDGPFGDTARRRRTNSRTRTTSFDREHDLAELRAAFEPRVRFARALEREGPVHRHVDLPGCDPRPHVLLDRAREPRFLGRVPCPERGRAHGQPLQHQAAQV
jgi:enoyl-CoA hydratase